jgi:aryl-alcohol dehydrogenase-like predicted oxidoreductase
MRPMATSRGVTVSAIAIAWLLHQEVVSTVILGARRPDQLAENLAASDIELTGSELTALDALGALEPEYPGWAIASQNARHGFRVSPRRQRK